MWYTVVECTLSARVVIRNTMEKKLNWRLGKLPSPDEVRELVKDKIITQDEAREILFSEQEETERDIKSLESEIKFLRELVDKLSKNSSTIVETIRYIEEPYVKYPWYGQYQYWGGVQGNAQNALATF